MIKLLACDTKKLIYFQTFTCYITVNIQILSSAKPASILGINPIVVKEGHLSHTKKYETFQLLIGCKCYLCL